MRFKPAALVIALLAGFVAGWASHGIDWHKVAPIVDPTPTTGEIFGVVVRDAEGNGLSRAQSVALESGVIAEYLAAHGLKENGAVEWREWDDDKMTADALIEESPRLRECYAIAKKDSGGKYPWLVVSNATEHGYSGPLPDGTDAAQVAEAIVAILKKYGG